MPARITRAKKIAEEQVVADTGVTETVATVVKTTSKADPFTVLIKEVSNLQSVFENLQKEIIQTKENWVNEQKIHQLQLEEKNKQEELTRKREQETSDYEMARKHKKEEDEFNDKKAQWEKSLRDEQETLSKERVELAELRKLVAGFEGEKERVVALAKEALEKELTGKFETERKLKEQEQKAEKDLSNLRMTNLTNENNKLNTELASLKKALDEANQQVKEIAVRVIESGTKVQASEFSSVPAMK